MLHWQNYALPYTAMKWFFCFVSLKMYIFQSFRVRHQSQNSLSKCKLNAFNSVYRHLLIHLNKFISNIMHKHTTSTAVCCNVWNKHNQENTQIINEKLIISTSSTSDIKDNGYKCKNIPSEVWWMGPDNRSRMSIIHDCEPNCEILTILQKHL